MQKTQYLSKEIGMGVAIPCWRRSQFSNRTSYQPENPVSAQDSRISPRAKDSRISPRAEGPRASALGLMRESRADTGFSG